MTEDAVVAVVVRVVLRRRDEPRIQRDRRSADHVTELIRQLQHVRSADRVGVRDLRLGERERRDAAQHECEHLNACGSDMLSAHRLWGTSVTVLGY